MLFALILPALALEPLDADAVPLPPMLGHGEQLAWRDQNGENVVSWSADPGGIFIHHFRVHDGRVYRVQQHEQLAPPCPDSDQTFQLDGAPTLSDADADGIAEVTFAVISACITDMSAKEVTISLWEDGAAHLLEGQTIWWDSMEQGTTTPTVLDHAVSREPALRGVLEGRYASLIEAERRSVSPAATVTAMPLR